jgi:hypothetical protein
MSSVDSLIGCRGALLARASDGWFPQGLQCQPGREPYRAPHGQAARRRYAAGRNATRPRKGTYGGRGGAVGALRGTSVPRLVVKHVEVSCGAAACGVMLTGYRPWNPLPYKRLPSGRQGGFAPAAEGRRVAGATLAQAILLGNRPARLPRRMPSDDAAPRRLALLSSGHEFAANVHRLWKQNILQFSCRVDKGKTPIPAFPAISRPALPPNHRFRILTRCRWTRRRPLSAPSTSPAPLAAPRVAGIGRRLRGRGTPAARPLSRTPVRRGRQDCVLRGTVTRPACRSQGKTRQDFPGWQARRAATSLDAAQRKRLQAARGRSPPQRGTIHQRGSPPRRGSLRSARGATRT